MSNFYSPVGGPGVGLWLGDVTAYMMVRGGAAAVGDLMAVDVTDTDAGTTVGTALGTETSTFGNMVTPLTAHIIYGLFGVAMEAAADDARCLFKFAGFVNINGPATTVGLGYGAANASKILVATATTTKTLAIARETSATNPSIKSFAFNGISGFGNIA